MDALRVGSRYFLVGAVLALVAAMTATGKPDRPAGRPAAYDDPECVVARMKAQAAQAHAELEILEQELRELDRDVGVALELVTRAERGELGHVAADLRVLASQKRAAQRRIDELAARRKLAVVCVPRVCESLR